MVDKMSYECDVKLGAPAEVDCAQVEWSELGPDDETVDLGSGLSKVLTSSTYPGHEGSSRSLTWDLISYYTSSR